MEGDSFASGVQTAAVLESVEKLIGEKKYREAEVGAIALLPEVPFTAYDVRLRIFSLLLRCPSFHFCEPEREDARRVATYVMYDRQSPSASRLMAHLLNRRALLHELRRDELSQTQALDLAKRELAERGGGKEGEILAHTLICCHTAAESGQDIRKIGEHLSALFLLGDAYAIREAVCGVGSDFHRETHCQYLDRALAEVEDPLFRADILVAKMGTLVTFLMECGDDADKQEKWMEEYENAFQEIYIQLQLQETHAHQRARLQVFLGVFSALRDDGVDLTELHLEAGRRIAQELNRPDVMATLQNIEEFIDALEKERAKKDKSGNEDDDDDDDDDDEWWKKGPKSSAD